MMYLQQAVAPTSDDPMRFGPGSYGEFPADQSGQVMPSQREHKASTADVRPPFHSSLW